MPYADPSKNAECKKRYKIRQRDRWRRIVTRLKVQQGCTLCGYNEHPAALDFDHIDRTSKNYNISTMVNQGRSDASMEREIVKCRVLCANCHRVESTKDSHFRPVKRKLDKVTKSVPRERHGMSKLTPRQVEFAIELSNQGKSSKEIGKILKVRGRTIRYILQKGK